MKKGLDENESERHENEKEKMKKWRWKSQKEWVSVYMVIKERGV